MKKVMATIAVAALLLVVAGSALAQTARPTATTGATAVPGMGNLMQTADSQGNLKTFTSLVNKAGLADTLGKGGPYTVLAPSDDAFSKLPPGALNAHSGDMPRLKSALSNHIVQGKYTANQLLDAKKVTTIDGKTLTILPRQGSLMVGNGFINKEDIPASNGFIQVMDNVQIPA